MAGGRVDEVPDNVFQRRSRINSTWGGNLTDMVRSRRYLEVIDEDGLVDRAAVLGKRLLDDLRAVPGIDNVRGRGLFVAFDLPDAEDRDGGAAAPARGPRAGARRWRALDPAASGVDHRGGRPGAGRPARSRRRYVEREPWVAFIGGTWRDDAAGRAADLGRPGRPARRSPRPCWPTPAGFVEACRDRPRRPARLGRHPAPGARAGGRAHRPASSRPTRRRWPRWSPARSASRWPSPAARCRR